MFTEMAVLVFLVVCCDFLWDQAGGKSALLLWVCVSAGDVTVSSRVEQGIKKEVTKEMAGSSWF